MKVIVEVCAIGISDVHVVGEVTVDLEELQRKQEIVEKKNAGVIAQAYMADLLIEWMTNRQDLKDAHLHLGHILKIEMGGTVSFEIQRFVKTNEPIETIARAVGSKEAIEKWRKAIENRRGTPIRLIQVIFDFVTMEKKK